MGIDNDMERQNESKIVRSKEADTNLCLNSVRLVTICTNVINSAVFILHLRERKKRMRYKGCIRINRQTVACSLFLIVRYGRNEIYILSSCNIDGRNEISSSSSCGING